MSPSSPDPQNDPNNQPETIPATALLSTLITTPPPTPIPTPLLTKTKQFLLDYIAVVLGGSHFSPDSSTKIYNSILSLQGGPLPLSRTRRLCTVLGKAERVLLPQYAAMVNAAWGHSLDFDDTFEKGTLHAGGAVISGVLAQVEILIQDRDEGEREDKRGDEEWERELMGKVLHAICIGYEVTCRLGRELGYEAYDRGFHNTGTAGVFGAVAAISSLKGLDAKTVEMAFGLAGSKAAGSMQYLENGSWNKRLHPGFAVHDAFICVGLAEGGVVGATRAIEGRNGFLQAYSPNPNVDLGRLVEGLGTEWVWMGSSLKPYPACRMTHGFIELAGNIRDEFLKREGRELRERDVREAKLSMSHANFLLVGTPAKNKIHPENVIDAQFSAYFQTANALLYGSNTGLEAYKKLQDLEIRALCAKTVIEMDPSIPKGFPAYIHIVWKDGKVEDRFQEFPLGEVQHPFTQDKVNEKFMSLVVPALGENRATQILEAVEDLENRPIGSLLALLR